MTIENALLKSEEVKSYMKVMRLLGCNIDNVRIKEIENVIEALEKIIFWYDRNQQNLIKALVKRKAGEVSDTT